MKNLQKLLDNLSSPPGEDVEAADSWRRKSTHTLQNLVPGPINQWRSPYPRNLRIAGTLFGELTAQCFPDPAEPAHRRYIPSTFTPGIEEILTTEIIGDNWRYLEIDGGSEIRRSPAQTEPDQPEFTENGGPATEILRRRTSQRSKRMNFASAIGKTIVKVIFLDC